MPIYNILSLILIEYTTTMLIERVFFPTNHSLQAYKTNLYLDVLFVSQTPYTSIY